MSFTSHVQKGALGAKVTLYHIDLSMFGEADLFLTNSQNAGAVISFGGQPYTPHPIKAKGFALKVGGTLPRPKLTVSNVGGLLTALVEQNDDLQGAVVTRTRTYERFLDGGAEPDGSAHRPVDVFEVSRKTSDTNSKITFQLKSYMDQEGSQLPRRIITKGYCSHPYRRADGNGGFDYVDVTCPYTGTDYFDESDSPTTAGNDACSKRLGGCRARFGDSAPLPTRAFPGVSRLRVR